MKTIQENDFIRLSYFLLVFSFLGLIYGCGDKKKDVKASNESMKNDLGSQDAVLTGKNENYSPKYWLEGIYENREENVKGSGK